MTSIRRIFTGFFIPLVLLLAAAAWAQDQPAQDLPPQSQPKTNLAKPTLLDGLRACST